MPKFPTDADYVIVGSGSSGSVLANRLSADPRNTVVLLEAGLPDKDKFAHIPAAFSKLFRSELDWDYATTKQSGLGGRSIYWPRGKMLGGSSSMNAMMWVRGFAADYDEWATHSDSSWAFENVLKYFRKIENVEGATEADTGNSGPMIISHQRSPRGSTAAYLDAAVEVGYPVERANLAEPQGFTQTMVNQKRGARWSAADGYLRPAMKRSNLTVLTQAMATRIVFEGTTAVGIEYEKDGAVQAVRARKQVVLAGGAINTPQLLMLSGVGDSAHLTEHGIDVTLHQPEIGKNLLDHLVSAIGYKMESDSLFTAEKVPELVNYLARRRGMLTSNVAEAYGFIRSRADLELPDLELIYAPAPFFDEGLIPHNAHAAILGAILVKPESRGSITLDSADPRDKPIIDANYLGDSGGVDRRAMIEGLRVCASMADSPSLKGLLVEMVRPSVPVSMPMEEVLERALEENAHTLYHPVGTCRMGNDSASVVDPQLRVRGLSNLTIADASIMPTIIRGHTHAPSVVIGEKASDMLLGRV